MRPQPARRVLPLLGEGIEVRAVPPVISDLKRDSTAPIRSQSFLVAQLPEPQWHWRVRLSPRERTGEEHRPQVP
jgi:hypothetical protein